MKIASETIPLIEKAIGFKLFPWQVDYLLNDTYAFPDICPCLIDMFDTENIRRSCENRFDGKRCRNINRKIGKTTGHCIDLALSNGYDYKVYDKNGLDFTFVKAAYPIDTKKMELYSDYGDGSVSYARGYYRKMFLEIWHQLKAAGLPVRELRF